MRKSLLPAAAAAATLAACSAAPEARADDPAPRTLVATGTGEAAAAPDLLTLSIGVETEAETAAEALRRNNVQMQAAIDRLKQRGVAEKDMQTSNFSVNPRYDYQERRAPRIVGYTASNMLSVRLRDLDKAGVVIDEVVADGANRLNGLSFGFSNDAALLAKAREAAVADAKAKAETLARAAGVSLGPVIQIQEGRAESPIVVAGARMAMAEAKDVPIQTGESTIAATVTLVYEIR
ncbi:SIMPL domain-containing protein [Amphiplicatus metriothermophilus]|uniref:26 kDa periplasmic immunogenic protein n=1 Tax=Amphiplicatus metriothermophilus TaxID=1519374 RepID=A0A239PYP2_9PROT|nr:SIMPL domain-containing protein [Amphiplicatus metriothermophilus]MBB5519816.1 hypothetical protein [Amphiplicatus metriothermophilus]SNT75143.1 hypothetical protein SAMN06297382_2576 [Amphiplicatus metriothermophilus]